MKTALGLWPRLDSPLLMLENDGCRSTTPNQEFAQMKHCSAIAEARWPTEPHSNRYRIRSWE